MACGWVIICILYNKSAPNFGRLNTYLDLYISTLTILWNEDLAQLYYMNFIIQNNIDFSKAIDYTNITNNMHLEFIISCPATIPLLSLEYVFFSFQNIAIMSSTRQVWYPLTLNFSKLSCSRYIESIYLDFNPLPELSYCVKTLCNSVLWG